MINPNKAYTALADLYESLMEVDYDSWADYIIGQIKAYAPGVNGVDAGCGSGAFTRRFKGAGFNVCGCDISEEMLEKAMVLSRQDGYNITFYKQDIRSFKSMGKVDFITALTDCLNYVDTEGMKKAFRRFASSLVKGGALIFDVSSEYKIKNIIANNMFGDDAENYSYTWFNTPFEGGVTMDISLFVKQPCGLYEKKEESHTQYIHTEEEIECSLTDAGFKVVSKQGHLGQNIDKETERINYVAVRI